MTSRKDELRAKEIPDVVVDPSTGKRYIRGKFLGKVRFYVGSRFSSAS